MSEEDKQVVPVTEEQLKVDKEKKITGGVRVEKSVHEVEETVDEPLMEQTVEVRRVPVDEFVEEAATTQQRGKTTVIPVHEEVLVVHKKLRLKEEIHITRHEMTRQESATVLLRREEATVSSPEESEQTQQSPPATRSS